MAKISAPPRSDNINIRVAPEMLGLIDRAARVRGKTRTDFILDTMRRACEDVMLDQRLFLLDEGQWSAFTNALDAPLEDNARLSALLGRKPAWEA